MVGNFLLPLKVNYRTSKSGRIRNDHTDPHTDLLDGWPQPLLAFHHFPENSRVSVINPRVVQQQPRRRDVADLSTLRATLRVKSAEQSGWYVDGTTEYDPGGSGRARLTSCV